MTTTFVAAAGFVSSAAQPFRRLALAIKMVPGIFITRVKRTTTKGHGAPTAIIAGHTTDGMEEISEEVTAIPLEKRDGCHRGVRLGADGQVIRRAKGRHDRRDEGRRQRVKLTLRSRGERSAGDRRRRRWRL